MFSSSIKRYTYIFFFFVVTFLLNGCVNNTSGPQISNGSITSQSTELELQDNSSTVDDNDNSAFTSDNIVPKEWLTIYTTSEALNSSDEIIKCDYSDADIADVIVSLVNKNVLFFATIKGEAFEIQWDNPITSGDSKTVIYPIKSSIFTDIENVYALADSTYNISVIEKYLTDSKDNGNLFYEDENNQLCVNPDNLSNWSSDPFYTETYIEITDVTDNRCSFIWHYPDLEGLNKPEGLQYYYYEKQYTATYSNGIWTLDSLIFDN